MVPTKEGGDTMGHLSNDDLFQFRDRTLYNIWLNDTEDILSQSSTKQMYVNQLELIDNELTRRGFRFA